MTSLVIRLTVTAALFLGAGTALGFVLDTGSEPTIEQAYAIVLEELEAAGATVGDAAAKVDAAIAQ